jgi:hypothetical protein
MLELRNRTSRVRLLNKTLLPVRPSVTTATTLKQNSSPKLANPTYGCIRCKKMFQ